MFFSFPHIAIDSDGNVGTINRPNRPGDSAACGALIAVRGGMRAARKPLPPPEALSASVTVTAAMRLMAACCHVPAAPLAAVSGTGSAAAALLLPAACWHGFLCCVRCLHSPRSPGS